MVATPGINNAIAIILCDAIVDAVDNGASFGHMEIRSGALPATCDDADAGTVLADINVQDPAFGAAVDNTPGAIATLAGTPLSDTSADATGTAAHFRMKDDNEVVIFQGTVGTATSDLIMTSVSIVATETVTLTSLTFEVEENA